MKGIKIKLFDLFGITVYLDFTWFIMFILFVFALNHLWKNVASPEISYLLSAILVIVLYLTLLAHELSHSLMAKKLGIPVHRIILWMFGGAAVMERQPRLPSQEFKITIVGPLSSLVIATLFFGTSLLIPLFHLNSSILTIFFSVVISLNIIWAIFNLLPAFPLDGGRIFRSILWYFLKNKIKATRIAVFICLPILIVVAIILRNLFILIIGIWVFMAGRTELKYARLQELQEKLSKIKVKIVMTSINPHDFNSATTIFSEAICSPEDDVWTVYEKMLQTKVGCFRVIENNQVIGLIFYSDIDNYSKKTDF